MGVDGKLYKRGEPDMIIEQSTPFNLVVNLSKEEAMYVAAKYGNKEAVDTLFELGVKAWTSHEAFLVAAKQGHSDILRAFIRAGCDRATYGPLALAAAKAAGHEESVQVLQTNGIIKNTMKIDDVGEIKSQSVRSHPT